MDFKNMYFGFFMLVIGFYLEGIEANMTQIVDVCCGLGTNWANAGDRCDDYYGDMPNIQNNERLMCRQVVQVCCIKSKQRQMCARGVSESKLYGSRCAIRDDILGAVTYKECCQCCQMGIESKRMGMSCLPPQIGNPCDRTFVDCCEGREHHNEDGNDGDRDEDIDGDEDDRTGHDDDDLIDEDTDQEGTDDINECEVFSPCSQLCVNTYKSFRCECTSGYKLAVDGRTCYKDDCRAGYAFNTVTGQCEDIDECVIGTHDCYKPNEICRNRRGTFYCECEEGYHRNRTTRNCDDIDECARRMDDCVSSQRCENTAGSFVCRRITPCGTGWTLDEATQECKDQDECLLDTHNCGTGYDCFNIEGSFRCTPKQCPEGFRFNSATTQCERVNCPPGLRPDSTSLCKDINECASRPGPCQSYQTCLNTYGSYRCVDSVNCRPGFEVGSDGQTCVDIDECVAGTHDCSGGAECINRPGSYVCSCPSGFTRLNGVCEDKNECEYGNVCPSSAVCENTRGSFRCVCDPGFETAGTQQCRDINECEDSTICTHRCTNLVGSYVCTCEPGYRLAADGRTCLDIDECRLYSGPGVCAGDCINTPGSYMCSCPNGWRIMGNGRSCQDIDECASGTDNCGASDDVMCFNTRGSFRCPLVRCPSGFSRSALGPRRNSVRCKRLSFTCRQGDQECINAPLSLSYNFLTFPTNVKVPTDLFSMSGPYTAEKEFDWNLNITSAYPRQVSVRQASRQDFDLQIGRNNAVVSLVNRIEGPQDIELMLTMKITDVYSRYTGYAISRIYLYVTSDQIS